MPLGNRLDASHLSRPRILLYQTALDSTRGSSKPGSFETGLEAEPYRDDKSGFGTAGYTPFWEARPTLAYAGRFSPVTYLSHISLPRRRRTAIRNDPLTCAATRKHFNLLPKHLQTYAASILPGRFLPRGVLWQSPH